MYQEQIRQILTEHGKLSADVSSIKDDADLYEFGLTSLITVGLMLAIEDEFDIEFPDSMLSRKTFQSIGALSDAVEDIID